MGARHWGKRWPPFGEDYGFNSYVLEKDGRRMLLACDSADTDLFASLASTPPDVAVFSIGAYDPWIWNHANPEQVWAMFESTGAHYLVPIHWGTFKLGKEPMEEPMQRLIKAAGDQQDQDRTPSNRRQLDDARNDRDASSSRPLRLISTNFWLPGLLERESYLPCS